MVHSIVCQLDDGASHSGLHVPLQEEHVIVARQRMDGLYTSSSGHNFNLHVLLYSPIFVEITESVSPGVVIVRTDSFTVCILHALCKLALQAVGGAGCRSL